MSTSSVPQVVVGIDGSVPSLAAVRAAALEAALRHRPLRVVHAFIWPLMRGGGPPGMVKPSTHAMRSQAEGLVAEAVAEAQKVAPDVRLTSEIVVGSAVPVLLEEGRNAALLVLGDRGLGGISGLVVGSVAVQTVTHAACPVMIVRGEPRADGPVVVGVDGSSTSARAVAFAVTEAELRRTELVAVHAWSGPASTGPGDMLPLVYDADSVEEDEEMVVAEALAGFSDRHPDVVIRREVVRGPARQHLVGWSQRAQLMVAGARGRGGFAGLLLGSVSQHLIYHSACPTVVVRADLADLR